MEKIPQRCWKAVEQAADETIAVVIDGPFKGMEIPYDWSQGSVKPATKRERLLSIIRDQSLVQEHQKMFLESKG